MVTPLALLAPVGRVFLALIFVLSGFGKLGDPTGAAAYIESGGLPGLLVWPTILLEIACGALVALGLLARPAALALGVFTLLVGVIYHLVPSQTSEGPEAMMQMISFQKNLAIAGGLLFVAATGPGPHALSRRSLRLSRA